MLVTDVIEGIRRYRRNLACDRLLEVNGETVFDGEQIGYWDRPILKSL